MFGPSLLVAPKVWPFMDKYSVSLPAGDWYDYWSGAKIAGGQALQVNPPLDTLPVYVRAGSIIPEQPVVQNTDEAPRGPLVLRVYPGPQCQGSLYTDDGSTLAYQKGQSMHVSFTCEARTDRVTVEIPAPTGLYQPWFREMQIEIYGISGKIKGVKADHRSVTDWKAEFGTVTLPALAWANAAHSVEVEIE
jgi:alpha-glucosidase